MNSTQFNQLMEMTFSSLKEIVNTKGREYSGDQDRLRNFKEGGSRTGVDPRTVLWVYLDKHYASITQYIKDQQEGVVRKLSEPIEGRIDDAILYLMLLKGLIKDIGQPEMVLEVPMKEYFKEGDPFGFDKANPFALEK